MPNYLDCLKTKRTILRTWLRLSRDIFPLQSRPQPADDYRGDVTDVTVVRRMEQQPGAALLWEPYIAQWKPRHLVVAFGAGIPGKTDMGDILACVSTDEGKTWSESVYVFDHNQRFGNIQFGYANPILYKPPGQEVIWCFAMRCPMAWQHSEDSQLCAAYSGDGGRSWLPVELTMHYTEGLIVVNGIHRIEFQGHPLYLLPAHCNSKRNDPHGRREQILPGQHKSAGMETVGIRAATGNGREGVDARRGRGRRRRAGGIEDGLPNRQRTKAKGNNSTPPAPIRRSVMTAAAPGRPASRSRISGIPSQKACSRRRPAAHVYMYTTTAWRGIACRFATRCRSRVGRGVKRRRFSTREFVIAIRR